MTKRILTTFGAAALLAQGLFFAGCGGSNEPSNTGNAGSTGTPGAAGTTGGAGTTGAAGATGAAGTTGSAGTSGTTSYTPLCQMLLTAAGEEPAKNVPCTATDPQSCWRTCGPRSVGFKPETCNGSAYAEGDCEFPANGDYSCYKIPAQIDTTVCPTTIPQASQDCTVAECTLCNLNGMYNDSSGAAKVGYCVCQPPNAQGQRRWSCASSTAWPCPNGNGC